MITAVLLALLPVIILIAMGYGLRRSGMLSAGFWAEAERLSYFILLPALLFHGLATADLDGLPVLPMAISIIGALLAVSAGLALARPAMPLDDAGFTSVFQGGIRFNTYIAATLAAGLYGAQGIALAAMCAAAIVPTVNLLCILVFARYGTARPSAGGVVRQLLTNPLVVACLLGFLVQALRLPMPPGIDPALRALGAASMPLGLFCVGAALSFPSLRSWLTPLLLASMAKFVLLPVMTLLLARIVGLTGPALVVVILTNALPTASSAYILARQLGGDAPMMAGITAVQTVLGAVAVPLVVALLLG
jgi:malonate transporter